MLTHPFHLKNTTNSTLQISDVRVSCGCVTATAVDTVIPPGKETAILAQMNTTRFNGVKTVTIFVNFVQPRSEEVRLWVQANSRDDVIVSPDAIAFGQVKRSTTPGMAVNVTFVGNQQWQVTSVTCDSNYVKTGIKEVRRDASEVNYQLSAQLRPDSPVGKWYTDVWLNTNNPATPRVRVPVTVEIESSLSVSPSLVDLGQVKVGSNAERKVMVRGIKPFKITELKGTDDEVSVVDTTAETRPVHVLAIKLKPGHTGDLKRQIRVITDLPAGESEIEFQTKAQIMP